jgi:hypothetical protein
MNVEIGAEAALFPEKEYINGIAVAVCNMENKVFCDDEVFEQIRPCGGGGGGDGYGEGPGGRHQTHKAEEGGVHHFRGGSRDVRNRVGNFRQISGTGNSRNSFPNHSLEEKNAWTSVQWDKNRCKPSEFRSEPFAEEKNARNSVSV